MRLLSWNVRDLLGDPAALYRVVRAADPDVLCLQEAPRRPGAAVRLWFLEQGTGLRCVAGGRRSGGTAVFVAPHVLVGWARAFRLPVAGRFTRTRGAAVVDLSAPGAGEITVASVHLPLRADERLEHVRLLCGLLGWRGRSVVVTGDLNEPAGAPAWQAWTPYARDPWAEGGTGSGSGDRPTFPAHDPRMRIDAVLVSPRLQAHAPDDVPWRHRDVRRASDHVPLLAEITRPPPP